MIVPDGDLHRLPFATLRNRRTGRFLVEERAVALSPSAAFFVLAAERLKQQQQSPTRSALLVGASTAAERKDRSIAALPGADAEVMQAASFYADRSVLTGIAATKQRFLHMAPDYDVVHFGGHALVNADYPLLSQLVFSSDPKSDRIPLFAYEIARIRFTRTRLVILAACSTASGTMARGEGVISVARPFLAAGVPTVIASQWDVDDRATERLFVAFHRAYSKTGNSLESLRMAQIESLRDRDPSQASPAAWGAFVILGAVTP